MRGTLRQSILLFVHLVFGVSLAQAGIYEFSYTFSAGVGGGGARLSGIVEGTPDQSNPNRIIVTKIESARLDIPNLLDANGVPFSYEYPVNNETWFEARRGTTPTLSFDGNDLDLDVCFRFDGSLATCQFSNTPALAEYGFYLSEDHAYFPDPDTATFTNYDADGDATVAAEYPTGGPGSTDSVRLRDRSDYLYLYDDEEGILAGPGNLYEEDDFRGYRSALAACSGGGANCPPPEPNVIANIINGELVFGTSPFLGSWSLVSLGGGGGLGTVDPTATVQSDNVDASVDIGANSVVRQGVSIAAGSSVGANTRIRRDASVGANVAIANNVIVARNVRIGDNTSVDANAIIRRDALVGTNANISASAIIGRDAQIGSNTQVGVGVRIRRQSVILDSDAAKPVSVGLGVILGRDSFTGSGVNIGSFSIIRSQSAVGSDSNIGSNVIIRRDSDIGNGVTIGDGTRLGRRVVVCPGVTIGSSVRIGRNVMIMQSVPDNGFIPRQQTPPDPVQCPPQP